MEPAVSQPVLYVVIGSLAATIGYLFKLLVSHHVSAVKDWREERAQFIPRLDKIENAITRQSKVELMRFCVSPHVSDELRQTAKTMLEEIKDK